MWLILASITWRLFFFFYLFTTHSNYQGWRSIWKYSLPGALLATFFWALNPVHVTSVTYIVQRYASITGLFYIMSMYFYLKGCTTAKSTYSISFFILCFTAGLAAVLSKEMQPCFRSAFYYLIYFYSGRHQRKHKKIYQDFRCAFFADFNYRIYLYERFFQCFRRLWTSRLLHDAKAFNRTSRHLILSFPVVVSDKLPLNFSLWFWSFPISVATVDHNSVNFIDIVSDRLCLLYCPKASVNFFLYYFYFLNHLIEGSIFNLELIYDYRNYCHQCFCLFLSQSS